MASLVSFFLDAKVIDNSDCFLFVVCTNMMGLQMSHANKYSLISHEMKILYLKSFDKVNMYYLFAKP